MGKRKWTKEMVIEESQKCSNRTDFRNKYRQGFLVAKENGWLDEIEHFKPHNTPWTKESTIEESKKYQYVADFKKHGNGAYKFATKHGLLKDMNWLIRKQKPNCYWKNKDNVINAGKECQSISEFERKYSAGYMSALNNGWLEELKTFYSTITNKFPRLYWIYAYVDNENMVAYVGLTNDKEERHRTHTTGLYRGKNSMSEVYKYFNSINKEIPKPIYLENELTSEQARIRENYWKNYYEQELKYTMLNIAKCGALGSGMKKWAKEKVFEVSKTCKTRTEFFHKYNRAYCVAAQNKWLDDMTWLISPQKPKNYWNEQTTMEECKKYNSLKDLRENAKSAYYAICKFKLNQQVKDYFNNTTKVG